jgi:pyruvate kinase
MAITNPIYRKTKIVATMGPALDDLKVLDKTIHAGVDVLRCNFSHDTHEGHKKRITQARKSAEKAGRQIAIFADLQGPKIRIARFKKGAVTLKENAKFILDAALDDDAGNEKQVGIDYKELPQDVKSGDILLLDDGLIRLHVDRTEGTKIFCRVLVGGILKNNKGLNRMGGGLSAKALTDKDKDDLKFAASIGVDYFAVSFVRSAEDIEEAKLLIKKSGSTAGVIAKIERAEALDNLEEITKASDAVMVARGDLGIEIGYPQLPAAQKRIIQLARELDTPVITATQMMESMVNNVIPTRAEILDVANAASLYASDAVMLSAESATGKHPHIVVETMAQICLGAEKIPEARISRHRLHTQFERIDESIAMATMYIANHFRVKAIICLTESGYTPLLMSRIRTNIPIFAFTRNISTERKMNLYRGVHPIPFDVTKIDHKHISHSVGEELKKRDILEDGDLIIITRGDILGEHGHTNLMKIYRVGD